MKYQQQKTLNIHVHVFYIATGDEGIYKISPRETKYCPKMWSSFFNAAVNAWLWGFF